MVKNDPIKIEEEENLKKKQIKKTVWRPTRLSTALNKEESTTQIFDRPSTARSGLSTVRGQNWIQVFFSGACVFLFWKAPNRTQILFIEGCVSKNQRV